MLALALAALLFGAPGPAARADVNTNGPTIPLRFTSGPARTSPVADFMYFVALISPVPVASLVSPGNTQALRMISCKRSQSGHSFSVSCEMEVNGAGRQQSLFDIGTVARKRRAQLRNGKPLGHQLKSIDVRGAGVFVVDVKGEVLDDVPTVNEVRLHFNARGHASPVWIDICDIILTNGDFAPTNEILARVNTLTFERKPGPAKMKVSIASIKGKNAKDGFWQNLKGRIEGATANLFIPPLGIESVGNQTMLDFGGALMSQAQTFTFPKARNLRASVPSLSN